jgi:hypothetical protein
MRDIYSANPARELFVNVVNPKGGGFIAGHPAPVNVGGKSYSQHLRSIEDVRIKDVKHLTKSVSRTNSKMLWENSLVTPTQSNIISERRNHTTLVTCRS